ncbi:MAG: hypothetical protein ABSH41_29220, partial [Syntrophobacteraceae bacterium]
MVEDYYIVVLACSFLPASTAKSSPPAQNASKQTSLIDTIARSPYSADTKSYARIMICLGHDRRNTMAFDPTTFWSSVAGAALPSLAVGVATWALTSRTNRLLARYQAQLTRDSEAVRAWQVRRVEALVEVYDAFGQHLDFLRRFFYWPE